MSGRAKKLPFRTAFSFGGDGVWLVWMVKDLAKQWERGVDIAIYAAPIVWIYSVQIGIASANRCII